MPGSVPTPAPDAARPTLDTLRRGESGHIERLSLPPTQAARLAGLGLCEGRLIEVISRGNPMIVRACGSTLALGRQAARGVEMCVCDTPSCPWEGKRHPAHADAPVEAALDVEGGKGRDA